MAVLKIKNALGEWEDVVSLVKGGGKQLLQAKITTDSNRKSLDISNFVSAGDDFMLFYTCYCLEYTSIIGAAAESDSYIRCLYMPELGETSGRQSFDENTDGLGDLGFYGGVDRLFSGNSSNANITQPRAREKTVITYKDGILTCSDNSVLGTSALLVYVG